MSSPGASLPRLPQPTAREIEPTLWVVLSAACFADPASVLIRRLEEQDQRVVLVEEAGRFERLGLNRFVTPARDRDAYARLLQLLAADGNAQTHLVYLRGMTESEPTDPLAPAGSYDLLTLVQAAIAAGLAPTTTLTVATSGAMSAGALAAADGTGEVPHPWQAPLWGVARTVMNERSDIGCRLVDLDPGTPPATAVAALCDEMLHPDDENEILLRGGGRYAPRLTRGASPPPVPRDSRR